MKTLKSRMNRIAPQFRWKTPWSYNIVEASMDAPTDAKLKVRFLSPTQGYEVAVTVGRFDIAIVKVKDHADAKVVEHRLVRAISKVMDETDARLSRLILKLIRARDLSP